VNAKFGLLDAKNSDYMYKLHVTRLEDIYMNHKLEFPSPPAMLFRSPVSQLYGVNGNLYIWSECSHALFIFIHCLGLLVESDKKLKKKEGKWVNNFQKFSALAPDVINDHNKADKQETMMLTKNNKPPTSVVAASAATAAVSSSSPMLHRQGSSKSSRPISPSPILLNHINTSTSNIHGNNNRPASPGPQPFSKQCDGINHHTYQLKQQQLKRDENMIQMEDIIQFTLNNNRKKGHLNNRRNNRCDDIHVSEEELIMRGMYRLNQSQEEIYRNFVHMLAGFDNFDKVMKYNTTTFCQYYHLHPYDNILIY